MGNITSGDVVNDDLDGQLMQAKEDAAGGDENLLDFSVLFEMESLQKALLNIKDPPGNLLTRHKEQIVKWLKSLLDREETTVNIVQFVDFLGSKGASKDEAMEVFCDFDVDGEGTMNITALLSVVKGTDPDPIQALLPCHELPGSLEIFLEDKNKHSGLAKALLKFVQRNRVDSSRLTMTVLAQIYSTLEQRLKLVQGRHLTLLSKQKDEEILGGADIDEGMARTIIHKCYTKISASSTERSIDNLLDNRMSTYWQSSGSPRSHWIRLKMIPGILLKELSISVSSEDDSYMPKNLTVVVGNHEEALKEIKSTVIPREFTGRFVVVQNLGTEYRYIQINFRGCHSDGCDTRVRGLHVKGCKLNVKAKPAVLDTMAIWYLRIIASTAKAAMPVAPQLRTTIIEQSKSALESLPPLSISPHSPLKPEFLSPFVVKEMDSFLTTLCLPEETYVSVDSDSLQILLSFAFAHGTANTILDVLQILLDNVSLELPLAPLLRGMEEIKKQKNLKHCECMKLSLVNCDGGQKDDSHRPDAMVTNLPNTTSNPYISESGKAVVTLVVVEESKQIMKLTRVHVKVPAGDNGARAGLLFVANQDPTSGEELTKKLEQYNGWTAEDYNKFKKEKEEESEGSPVDEEVCPVAYFELDKDTYEVEFTPDWSKTGKYLVFKFFASPKKEEEESTEQKVAVHSVQAYGHKYTQDELLNLEFLNKLYDVAQLPTEEEGGDNVEGGVVLVRVLGFLATMLRDLHLLYKRRKAASLDPTLISEEHLAVDDLSLEKIWNLYIPLTLNPEEHMEKASFLCLQVLRSALPFIKVKKPSPSSPSLSSTAGSKSTMESSTSPSAILSHLCGLLDAGDTHPVLMRLAQDIVVDGVLVFFPDAEARKNYLLSMLKSVLDKNQPRSWWLKFEALCHYFSTSDSHSLLGLPHQVTKENVADLSTSSAHSILNTMLACAMKEGINCIENGSGTSSDLIKLICALQATAFFWCKKHLTSSDSPTEAKEMASTLLTDYLISLEENVYCLLTEILDRKEIPSSLPKLLENSLLSRVVPEMLVFLETVVEADIDKVEILHTLQRLVRLLGNLTKRVPDAFLTVDTKVLTALEGVESVVGVWHRESPHNYENNSRVNEEFVCSAANRFVIEFDSKCHTERRYDYLEFTDAAGAKSKYDGEVGSERWPRRVEFKGQRLHLYFYSDTSNNEWGYKFTLKAYGHSLPPLGWLFDLQVTLSHLLGLLCSSVLSTKQIRRALPGKKVTEEAKEEEKLVHSDIWKTLFRGGSMVSKLTRSLSGAYYASSPSESKLAAILEDLVNGPEGPGVKLVEKCREEVKGQYYGGPLVDKAVSAVFAALIWHTQEIRQDLTPFACASEGGGEAGEPTLTPGLLSAFKAAESMRRELVEAKQKLMEEKEKEENEEKKAQVVEDTPVNSCHNKASFLLKFSGLTKVPTSKEDLLSPTSRPGWAQKSRKWQKVSTAVSTVGVLKQSLQTDRGSNSTEKFPSFELVLNFVGNEALSEEKVRSLLKQREESARAAAQTYGFIADYIEMMDDHGLFELPALAFLQQLLAKQRHFPKHYAAKLDGCGLDLENQVRKSYRLMLIRLTEALNSFKKPPSKEHSLSRLLVQTYLTHLLDFEWQDYDYALLCELHLPEFFIESAIRSSGSEDRTVVEKFEGEEEMLKRYALHMKLLEKFKKLSQGESWKTLMESTLAQENFKEAHLFLVCMSHSHPHIVSLQCDGCESTIKARWYRDMDYDEDLDLCPKCFESGNGSRPTGFSEEHMFQCLGKYGCDSCGMSIITHRFHSNTRKDFDLCLGCLRKEEETGKYDEWSVFLLTEHPAPATCKKFKSTDTEHATGHLYKEGVMTKMGGAMDLMVYTQHHCWILFSSLCLTVAKTINNSITTGNGPETPVEYLNQASQIKFECLKLLAFLLRGATLAKIEEAEKKKSTEAEEKAAKEEAKDQKEEEEEKEKEKEEEGEPVTSTESSTATEQRREAPPISRVVADTTSQSPSKAREVEGDSSCPAEPEEDPIIAATKQTREGDSKIGTFEKIFSVLSINRTLCLLGAILPQELSLAHWIDHKRDIEVFLTEELLPNLLQLSYSEGVSGLNRHASLLVAVSYMARVTPKVADRAVELAQGEPPSSSVDPGENTYGLKTAQFLFAIGAKFLKKSDFAGATMCAECLLLLSQAPPWKLPISLTVNQYLQTSPQDMDLSSVFALLVIAGFPRLPREGSILSSPSSDDKPERVLLVSLGEGGSGSAIDVDTRLPVTVKLSDYKVEDTLRGCVDSSRLSTLVPLLKTSIQLAKQDSDRLVEDTWILSLVMKALHVMLKSEDAENVIKGLLDKGLVAPIVQLASKPTHFSLKWRLDDLEVLGISSYSPAAPKEEEGEGEKEKEGESRENSSEKKKEGTEGKEAAAKEGTAAGGEGEKKEGESKSEEEEEEVKEKELTAEQKKERHQEAILEGLPDEVKEMVKMMAEVFMCKLSVLRAAYDHCDGEMPRFMSYTEQYYDDGFKPPAEIMEAAKKWEPETSETSEKTKLKEAKELMEDMGVTHLTPVEVDMKSIEALPEDSSIFKKAKLINDNTKPVPDQEVVSRQDSYMLLREELSKLKNQGKPQSREEICKTLQGIVVLRARQVLAALLSHWPTSCCPKLSTSFLGCVDITQYFCLLDLMLRQQNEDDRKKILSTVLERGEASEVLSLVVTAAQCMREVAVDKKVVELRHPGQGEDKLTKTGKIVFETASSIRVSFHAVKGKVIFASNESLSKNSKTLSASSTSPKDTHTHHISGNTVHYKVELESVSEAKYPKCCFTITGTQPGRFETGYTILNAMLCEATPTSLSLPLPRLWTLLITVACQHKGAERIKVIRLLQEIINRQVATAAAAESVDSSSSLATPKLELSALKPLWQLYTTLVKDYDERSKSQQVLSPEIVRVFTGLFLTVENLAETLGVSQELMVETLSKEALHGWLEKGISNVAFISLALGLDNTASNAFKEAKKNYVPPAKSNLLEETDFAKGEDTEDDDDDDDDDDHDDSSPSTSSDDDTYDSFSDYS